MARFISVCPLVRLFDIVDDVTWHLKRLQAQGKNPGIIRIIAYNRAWDRENWPLFYDGQEPTVPQLRETVDYLQGMAEYLANN